MKEVKLYIYSGVKFARLGIQPKSAVGFILSVDTPTGEVTLTQTLLVQELTKAKSELLALESALSHLKEPTSLTIHTGSYYLRNVFTDWIDLWIAIGWRTARGTPVKYQEELKQIHERLGIHTVLWNMGPHEYSEWLKDEVENRQQCLTPTWSR